MTAKISNFKIKKRNLWRDLLDLFGFDYKRITFNYGRDRYIISSMGKVTINDEYFGHVFALPQETVRKVYKEMEKMY